MISIIQILCIMYKINDDFRISSTAEEEEGGELSAEQTIAMRFASTRPVDISPLEFGKSTRYIVSLMSLIQLNNKYIISQLTLGQQMIFFTYIVVGREVEILIPDSEKTLIDEIQKIRQTARMVISRLNLEKKLRRPKIMKPPTESTKMTCWHPSRKKV